jgi:hypothetical protein
VNWVSAMHIVSRCRESKRRRRGLGGIGVKKEAKVVSVSHSLAQQLLTLYPTAWIREGLIY